MAQISPPEGWVARVRVPRLRIDRSRVAMAVLGGYVVVDVNRDPRVALDREELDSVTASGAHLQDIGRQDIGTASSVGCTLPACLGAPVRCGPQVAARSLRPTAACAPEA
jgi:hypothetical protein